MFSRYLNVFYRLFAQVICIQNKSVHYTSAFIWSTRAPSNGLIVCNKLAASLSLPTNHVTSKLLLSQIISLHGVRRYSYRTRAWKIDLAEMVANRKERAICADFNCEERWTMTVYELGGGEKINFLKRRSNLCCACRYCYKNAPRQREGLKFTPNG